MKAQTIAATISLGAWLVIPVTSLLAADAQPPKLNLEPEEAAPSRVRLSYRPGFNISAQFKNLGRTPVSAPGAAVGGVPHTYNDGFVLLDISGNAGGQTWNWGYSEASQIMGPNLVLSSSQPGNLADDVSRDPQHGLEFSYALELGQSRKTRWGVQAAFGYTDLNFQNRAVAPDSTLAVDAFALGGIIPPLAPYAGTFAGPGPLISDAPVRAPVNVYSRFDAAVYNLRLGPYLEVPLAKTLALTFSGGFAAAAVNGKFKYDESALVPGSGAWNRQARAADTAFHPGGYVSGDLSWQLSKAVNVFAGVQFQSVTRHTQTLNDKQAVIDLTKSIFLTAGLGVSF